MKRNRKVHAACMQCKRAHLSCSDSRPCERCVLKHIAHLCDDNSFAPQHVPLTSEEMNTMSSILGNDGFEFLAHPPTFDLLEATNSLDYAKMFTQDANTFQQNKRRAIITKASTPTIPTKIVHIPQTNGNPTMVHGIIVNLPTSSHTPAPLTFVPNPLHNVAVVRSIQESESPDAPPIHLSPLLNSPPVTPDPNATPVPLVTQDAIATALILRNDELKQTVNTLEMEKDALQRALEEKDKQLREMQHRHQQTHARLKILVHCQVIPQALDLELVAKSRAYGIMTALYDTSNGSLLDYNRNFEKMLVDVFGPEHEKLPLRWLPGPMQQNGVIMLIDMMIKDYFKESLEKYTCIRHSIYILSQLSLICEDIALPSGEKLPFVFSLTIQCWDRPAGPLMNCTYWI